MLHSAKGAHRSVRVFLIMAVDLLLISLSFFVVYQYLSGERSLATGVINVYLSVLIYDLLFILSLCLAGGYFKRTLGNFARSVLSIMVAAVISHLICALLLYVKGIFLFPWILLVGAVSSLLLVASRAVQKFLFDRYLRNYTRAHRDSVPTLIIGAGFSGKMVCRELTETEGSDLLPVCFVDDDKDIISTKVCGLPVFGPTVLIPQLCKKYNIKMIVFAIPSCPADQRKRILANCEDLDCDVRIVPSLSELSRNRPFFKQALKVDVEQLLGRDAVSIENTRVAEFIRDKVCLVTGGGGSIGSELCRQIVRMKPKRVVIVDIYENNAYEIQQELKRAGFTDAVVNVEIASVRDMEKMRMLFDRYRFDVVFHAAAHKHVPLMETNPEEAIKNNVRGTYNVAHLAHRFGVQKMVLISTDKAVNPTNVMGASKRVCEMIMQYMAKHYPQTAYTAVRFGNVLGSNGSVIPLFTKQIEAGGPVTVTHPDIIRYFMTIPEAVSLVLEAATMSGGGETFVLDMGEPVKIVTLAENLIKMYGYQPYSEMPIEFCGLREGEKLFEELLMDEENLKETYHKKIFISNQLEIDGIDFKGALRVMLEAAEKNDAQRTVALLHTLVPTFKTPDEVNGNLQPVASDHAEETAQENTVAR